MKKFLSLVSMVSAALMLVACGNSAAGSAQSLPGQEISNGASLSQSGSSSSTAVSSTVESADEDGYFKTGPFYKGYYSDEVIELVGDTYNEFTLKELKYRPESGTIGEADWVYPDESGTLKGEITLRGKLTILQVAGDIPTSVVFELDNESASKIPYPKLMRDTIREVEKNGHRKYGYIVTRKIKLLCQQMKKMT